MPVRLVHRQRQQDWLDAARERDRERTAMRTLLLLEELVPWAIISLKRDAQKASLLALHEHGGEVALTRAARIFAASDADRDGVLLAGEVSDAAKAIRDDIAQGDAMAPPDSISFGDGAKAAMWTRHVTHCEEALHEISLLRHLTGRSDSLALSVADIKAAAAASAHGNEVARDEAAAAALEEALANERVRASEAAAHAGGVGLLPFVRRFLGLIDTLNASREAVIAMANEPAEAGSNKASAIDLDVSAEGKSLDADASGDQLSPGAIQFQSAWQPSVELRYLEQRRRDQTRGLGSMLSAMIPD
jgi:hypothetical protein